MHFYGQNTNKYATKLIASGQYDPKGAQVPYVAVWRASDMAMIS